MKQFEQRISEELKRAEEKHPEWPTDLMYADQIVNEEKGEVTRAVVQYTFEGGDIKEVEKELIQTIVTCIRMLKGIEQEPSKGIEQKPLKLEHGKTYINRLGNEVEVRRRVDAGYGDPYKFKDNCNSAYYCNSAYTENGSYWYNGDISDLDLIEEVP